MQVLAFLLLVAFVVQAHQAGQNLLAGRFAEGVPHPLLRLVEGVAVVGPTVGGFPRRNPGEDTKKAKARATGDSRQPSGVNRGKSVVSRSITCGGRNRMFWNQEGIRTDHRRPDGISIPATYRSATGRILNRLPSAVGSNTQSEPHSSLGRGARRRMQPFPSCPDLCYFLTYLECSEFIASSQPSQLRPVDPPSLGMQLHGDAPIPEARGFKEGGTSPHQVVVPGRQASRVTPT